MVYRDRAAGKSIPCYPDIVDDMINKNVIKSDSLLAKALFSDRKQQEELQADIEQQQLSLMLSETQHRQSITTTTTTSTPSTNTNNQKKKPATRSLTPFLRQPSQHSNPHPEAANRNKKKLKLLDGKNVIVYGQFGCALSQIKKQINDMAGNVVSKETYREDDIHVDLAIIGRFGNTHSDVLDKLIMNKVTCCNLQWLNCIQRRKTYIDPNQSKTKYINDKWKTSYIQQHSDAATRENKNTKTNIEDYSDFAEETQIATPPQPVLYYSVQFCKIMRNCIQIDFLGSSTI